MDTAHHPVNRRHNPLHDKVRAFDVPQRLKAQQLYPYFRVIESDQDTSVRIGGKEVLMFGSNSYLGLTNHPEVKAAAAAAIRKYGTGCAGSRFLNGTLDIHIELEEALAEFVGKEAAVVFSTGFQVNIGAIPCLLGRHDYLVLDELDHASILEGSRLSFARTVKFRHNDMNALERILRNIEPDVTILIVVDGIFSMDGDIAPLPELVRLAAHYGATIMVDDAHSLGVIGVEGRGTASHFSLTDETDLIMGTFSKSLASIGGFIAADQPTINFIKHQARSLIFSASMSPAAAASALAALRVIQHEPARIQQLWSNTHFALHAFHDLGFDTGNTCTPIIPIYVRNNEKTFMLANQLLEEGVFVNPITAPAVAEDATLIRFSLMATHTREQIEQAIDKIHVIAKKLDIVGELQPHGPGH
ncbi:MAG: aminotransferase class I/II-fold pyridoxal phosphate-dependent enzyme [Bacteroidetes bacterium]|nr:aminotransferase class I/II-fold pyridoxal phosphate-dependent enzyme [Bacteroidota bacterium]